MDRNKLLAAVTVLVAVLILSIAYVSGGRYAFVPVSTTGADAGGRIGYKIDTLTGRMWWCFGTKLYPALEELPPSADFWDRIDRALEKEPRPEN